jgi:hypothetical protein
MFSFIYLCRCLSSAFVVVGHDRNRKLRIFLFESSKTHVVWDTGVIHEHVFENDLKGTKFACVYSVEALFLSR